MPKKKIGQHIQFYRDCMEQTTMPNVGLCRCGMYGFISDEILNDYFTPEHFIDAITFWASGEKGDHQHVFTPLRQTIVLFMACLNNEL